MSLIDNITGRLPIGGEFQGYNGDCVEYSLMVARCAVNPAYACDKAELDRLTAESIQGSQAGSAGQMTDANLVWLCHAESIQYVQITYDLNGLFYWLGQGDAVVCGFANGQALPGNEQGVQGHAVAVLAHDGTGFSIANGDSANGQAGQLDTGVTSGQLAAAQPTTLTVIQASHAPDLAGIIVAAQNIAAAASHISTDAQTIQAKARGE